MNQQNIADGIGWACQHQDLLTAGAVWFAAAVPASVTAWLASKWKNCPPWLLAILHLTGANFLQAAEAAVKPKPQIPPDPAG